MSFILDALKQAEQERGNGRLPSVMANYEDVDVEEDSIDWKKWLTIVISMNAVILLGWIAWRLFFIQPDTIAVDQIVQIDNTQIKNIETKSPIATDDEIVAESFKSPPVIKEEKLTTAQIEKSTELESVPQEVTRQPIEISKLPEFPVPEETELPATLSEIKVAAKLDAPIIEKFEESQEETQEELPIPPAAPDFKSPIEQNKIGTDSKAQLAKVEPLPAELLAESVDQEKTEVEPEELEVQQAIAILTDPQVPEFAELPYSLQQEIPEIRISVHIYNAEPSQRKARINGEIFRQGEQIDRDLSIEEITPHGVVFDYAGTLFRMNLR